MMSNLLLSDLKSDFVSSPVLTNTYLRSGSSPDSMNKMSFFRIKHELRNDQDLKKYFNIFI